MAAEILETQIGAEGGEEAMKAGDTKRDQKVRLACGCTAFRTPGWEGTTEPVFRAMQKCDAHRSDLLWAFAVLALDTEVTDLDS